MSHRLRNRLSALESRISANDTTAIGFVPASWTLGDGEEALCSLAIEQGLTQPFGVLAISQEERCEPELSFVGSLDSLLERVARESTRIGVPSMEARQ